MTMPPGLRKFMLTVHVAFSVGWIGAVAAYIALDVVAATSQAVQTLRATFIAMDLIASYVIVPLAFATLLTGLIMSLGTTWGLFRHYWTLVSFVLTTLATLVLLSETRTIGHHAAIAADPATSTADLAALGSTLLHSVGGMVVLLANMWLNVYKPRGLTRYGWRKLQEERARRARRAPATSRPEVSPEP